MTADLRAHLDRLDTAHNPVLDGLPWVAAVREEDDDEAVVLDSRLAEVAEVSPADAALIVAAVNALPGLLAAVRATADLADDLDAYVAARGKPAPGTYDDGVNRAQAAVATDLHTALAAALTEGDPA